MVYSDLNIIQLISFSCQDLYGAETILQFLCLDSQTIIQCLLTPFHHLLVRFERINAKLCRLGQQPVHIE